MTLNHSSSLSQNDYEGRKGCDYRLLPVSMDPEPYYISSLERRQDRTGFWEYDIQEQCVPSRGKGKDSEAGACLACPQNVP